MRRRCFDSLYLIVSTAKSDFIRSHLKVAFSIYYVKYFHADFFHGNFRSASPYGIEGGSLPNDRKLDVT